MAHGRQAALTAAEVLGGLPVEEQLILPCLQQVQRAFGYVSDEAVDSVAEFLNVSRAEVVGVLTYYHDLRSTPAPDVTVGICVAEACQAQGSRALVDDVERSGATEFKLEFNKVYCFGNCALGPAAMVNGRLIGRCDIAALRAAIGEARR